jgi:hypothetical protein
MLERLAVYLEEGVPAIQPLNKYPSPSPSLSRQFIFTKITGLSTIIPSTTTAIPTAELKYVITPLLQISPVVLSSLLQQSYSHPRMRYRSLLRTSRLDALTYAVVVGTPISGSIIMNQTSISVFKGRRRWRYQKQGWFMGYWRGEEMPTRRQANTTIDWSKALEGGFHGPAWCGCGLNNCDDEVGCRNCFDETPFSCSFQGMNQFV